MIWLSSADAAARLNGSEGLVRKLADAGAIRTCKIGSATLYLRSDVDANRRERPTGKLSATEAAAAAGVSYRVLLKTAREGKIPHERYGSTYVFNIEDVERVFKGARDRAATKRLQERVANADAAELKTMTEMVERSALDESVKKAVRDVGAERSRELRARELAANIAECIYRLVMLGEGS